MRASSLFAAAVCAAAASAQVRLPFARRAHPIAAAAADSNVGSRAPGDRRSIPTLDVLANGWNYLVNVSVGTPPQQMSMRLAVQTGASWVPEMQYCGDSYGYNDDVNYTEEYASCRYGAFDANRSSSFVNPGSESFSAMFAGDYIFGDWIGDTLHIADTQTSKFVMGFVNSADTLVGVLGLGFNASYHSDGKEGSSAAVLPVPERLVKDGVIASPAYSLWLDNKSAKSGNLLMGAVDRSKFEGPLVRIRTNSFSRTSTSWRTRTFDTVIYSANGTRSATDELKPLGSGSASSTEEDYLSDIKLIPVQIAPEYPVSVLPPVLAQDIWLLAGASWNEKLSRTVIPCAAAETSTGHIAMQLDGTDGPVLNVSIADLVVSRDVWSSSKWSWDTESTTEYCMFGIQSDNSSSTSYFSRYYALGGAVLEQAYMVFDLANAEMAIAQTKLGSTAAEDVVPFATYGASIPESTMAKHMPSYCSDRTYSGNSLECTGDGSGSGSGGRSSDDYGDYDGDRLPSSVTQSAKLGFGLGVGLFCLLVLCLSIWAIRRCRRIRKAEKELSEKQADVEQGADAQAGTRGGDNVAQDGSLPQESPAAVTREPPTTNAMEGQHTPEDAVSTRP
ncbi:aspartic peptidase domain-containing protein [Colletotrichum cereale]|nr:aspartic peptidase domain-containing protein [Colletotrichum cereale]